MRQASVYSRNANTRVRCVGMELLGSGATFDEILEDHPYLEREDILAALEYAAPQADRAVLLSV